MCACARGLPVIRSNETVLKVAVERCPRHVLLLRGAQARRVALAQPLQTTLQIAIVRGVGHLLLFVGAKLPDIAVIGNHAPPVVKEANRVKAYCSVNRRSGQEAGPVRTYR